MKVGDDIIFSNGKINQGNNPKVHNNKANQNKQWHQQCKGTNKRQ